MNKLRHNLLLPMHAYHWLLPRPVRAANVMSRGRLAVDPNEFAAEDREAVKQWTM